MKVQQMMNQVINQHINNTKTSHYWTRDLSNYSYSVDCRTSTGSGRYEYGAI